MDLLIAIAKLIFSKRQSRRYYSQFGEDTVLAELFGRRKKKGTYVDVGCYHPRKHSNTYMLYKRGWSGILVDIEKSKIIACRLLRPRDTSVLAAVSDKSGMVDYYAPKKYSVLTSLNQRRPDFKRLGEIHCTTLTDLLDAQLKTEQIDLLSIDVEGHDFNVLKSLDFSKYRPEVIVIESWDATDIDAILTSEIHLFLEKRAYGLRGWTGLSLIYRVDNEGEIS